MVLLRRLIGFVLCVLAVHQVKPTSGRRPKGKTSNTLSLFQQQQMEVMRREVAAKENFFKELLRIEREKLQMLKAIAKPNTSDSTD